MDLRFTTLLSQTNTLNVRPSESLGLSNEARIRIGRKESSQIWHRMGLRDQHRMPSIGSDQFDEKALEVIGSWIDSLK